jgi:hypothetical protein
MNKRKHEPVSPLELLLISTTINFSVVERVEL